MLLGTHVCLISGCLGSEKGRIPSTATAAAAAAAIGVHVINIRLRIAVREGSHSSSHILLVAIGIINHLHFLFVAISTPAKSIHRNLEQGIAEQLHIIGQGRAGSRKAQRDFFLSST